MRKLRGGNTSVAGNTTGSTNSNSNSTSNGTSPTPGSTASNSDAIDSQTQITLMHLTKLFNEYTHPKEPLSEHERDLKLYNMLPLFCKVCFTE